MWIRHKSFLDQGMNSLSKQNNGSLNKLCNKIKICKKDLKNWNINVFGRIGTELEKTCALLASLQDTHLTRHEVKQMREALLKYE